VFKKYPVCFSAHRAIDAVLRLTGEHALVPSGIASIKVSVRGTQARVLRFDRPRTALEAKFSMQFAVACASLRGRVGLQDLHDGFVASEPVQSMFGKVRFVHLPPGPSGKPPLNDRVVITLNGGRVLDSGPLDRVRPHTALREKFMDCCAAGGYAGGAQLFDRLQTLDKAPNLNRIR
jgi:aconitate decarboxylase